MSRNKEEGEAKEMTGRDVSQQVGSGSGPVRGTRPRHSPGWPGRAVGIGTGRCWAGIWACGLAWLNGAHGWAGQGCGQLETGPAAAASLGQGLTAPEC